MSQRKQGWISFYCSRSAIFLYKVLATMVAPAYATPLATSIQAGTSTATSPSAAASAISSKSNRDGSFQVLADGTQDLAALVGIFATNSVERYAFDYTRGYISSAVSMLSLLGLLGYVRALVKLGLGPKKCENAGFDTKALRPFFGVSDADRLTANKIYTVYYVERHEDDLEITWKPIPAIKHTRDSFVLQDELDWLDGTAQFRVVTFAINKKRRVLKRFWKIRIRNFHLGGHVLKSPQGDVFVILISMICVGLPSFLFVLLRGSSPPTWSLYFATVGLIVPTYFTSLIWAWVYSREQLPQKELPLDKSSFDSKYFAYMFDGKTYIVLDLRLITGYSRNTIRAMSLIAALLATVGYICQYIEVRRMSPRNSGVWLATQGVLALTRLAVWIADPAMDDYIMTTKISDRTIWSLSEKHLGLISMTRNDQPQDFCMPKWTADMFRETMNCIHEPFTVALSVYMGRQISGIDLLALLENAKQTWDVPEELFMLWVSTHHHTSPPLINSMRPGNAFGARVIVDAERKCHILPFWSCAGLKGDHLIKVFGNFSDELATVIHLSSHYERDKDRIIVGWPKLFDELCEGDESGFVVEGESTEQQFVEFSDLDHPSELLSRPAIRARAIKTMELMWRSLKQIFKRAASQHNEQLPDLFLDEEEAKNPEYPEAPAENLSVVPEPSMPARQNSFYW